MMTKLGDMGEISKPRVNQRYKKHQVRLNTEVIFTILFTTVLSNRSYQKTSHFHLGILSEDYSFYHGQNITNIMD